MIELNENQKRFLASPFAAVATTIRADGSPHSTVVWVEERDGLVEFNTADGRAKPRNLRRDPRASVVVVDPQDMYRWLAVSGPVELTEEGAAEQIDRLSLKYRGEPTYTGPRHDRLTVRMRPEQVTDYKVS